MSHPTQPSRAEQERLDYIKLKLTVLGSAPDGQDALTRLSVPYEVVAHLKERVRLSYGRPSPIDRRAQAFLDRYFADLALERPVTLPGLGQSFILDRAGMAQELSLPESGDVFESDIIKSYRLMDGQGVLHNPRSDRRTTQGVFHVAEGGAAIPDDKVAVPKIDLRPPAGGRAAAARRAAVAAVPRATVETFVSLMMRPIVVPEVKGVTPEKTMEVKFLAPGNLVSNLDFVERIFGNAGDPHLPENDAGADIEHWTGHTGYVILAPHLPTLPRRTWACRTGTTPRSGSGGTASAGAAPTKPYNNGNAFKVTARDEQGVMVTLIADNYYGYCKKEVKTQISFAANLLGGVEEEHAGGAMVHPQYDLGKLFSVATHLPEEPTTRSRRSSACSATGCRCRRRATALTPASPDIYYVPESVEINLNSQTVTWRNLSGRQSLPLDPAITYMVPSGFKVRLEKEADSGQWRLIGTTAEGTLIHKPSTVSGGGKSEISKPVTDAIMHGPFFIADFEKDMDAVEALLTHDYGNRFRDGKYQESRPILSPQRSLGSVIKLLTPSSTLYSDEYNAWLETIPHSIRELVYVVKRFYQPEMGENWRGHFSVDVVNGRPGNALKFDGERLVAHSMRVGFTEDGNWRTFSLRNDFVPAEKRQAEDDITASMVVPRARLKHTNPRYDAQPSVKFVENVERRFFQRPDEAIHRGYDKFTEAHFAQPDNFFSNYQPLTPEDARKMLAAPITLQPVHARRCRTLVRRAAQGHGYFVSSAHPRLVDGKPTKNPRYLQMRPDLVDARPGYLGEAGMRLHRQVAWGQPLYTPVNAVLPGRRLNPPDAAGIRSLAVYNPIHYQETPELFMELISSLTGKSPSTTGAGSEGALTKGPFNALPPIIDLNNALVSHILTGSECFVTAAGYVGPKFRVDHDISLLVPEVWARMEVHERDPRYLIENNFLEQAGGLRARGQDGAGEPPGLAHHPALRPHVLRHRLRQPERPVQPTRCCGPKMQDLESFVDGIDNIVSAQKSVAENYFRDGSVDLACPPLRALLHIMRDGDVRGRRTSTIPRSADLFTREQLAGERLVRAAAAHPAGAGRPRLDPPHRLPGGASARVRPAGRGAAPPRRPTAFSAPPRN